SGANRSSGARATRGRPTVRFPSPRSSSGRRLPSSPTEGDDQPDPRGDDSSMDLHQVKASGGVLIAAGVATLVVALVTIFLPDVQLPGVGVLPGFQPA